MRINSLVAAVFVSASTGAVQRLEAGFWTVPWDRHPPESPLLQECAAEVNPFAFAFDEKSRVIPIDASFLGEARRSRGRGPLIPVVVNDVLRPGGKMGQLKSRELLAELLSKPRGVQRHVEELSRLVESQGFDGIEIDYERVPPALWEPFTRFAEALAGELHRKGKRMNVALEPGALHRGKDQARILKYWPRLARCADALKFMCYYERGDYSKESGAGNSLAWVEDTARKALELVGPDKLWVALSLAGTDWVSASESSGVREVRRLHYGQVLKILSDSGAQVRWDPESASPYFRYVDSGERHEVWFEDERSLKAKVDALRAIGVKRVAIWYLGARHPDVRSLGLCPR